MTFRHLTLLFKSQRLKLFVEKSREKRIMDIADYFRKNLHRAVLDKNYKKKSLLGRKESLMDARRKTRDTLRFQNRKIDINMSPIITPAKPPAKAQMPVKQKNEYGNQKRLEMLKQWKEKKNKQKQEEKKNAKPIFKVFHVNKSLGLPNLENVNKEIKGKAIVSAKSFAPLNHKFHPPKNVKPVDVKAVFGKPGPTITLANIHNTQQKRVPSNKNISNTVSKKPKQIASVTRSATSQRYGSNVKRVVSSSSNNIKRVVESTEALKLRKNLTDGTAKQTKVLSVKVTKNVDWDSETTLAEQKKPQKKYQKTPRKAKTETVVLDNSDSIHIHIPYNGHETEEFQTPVVKNPTPRTNKKATNKDQSASTGKQKSSTSKVRLNREASHDNNCFEVNKNNLHEEKQERVIFYEDDELVLKTPIKKNRTPSHTCIPSSRPSSKRKTLGKGDKCRICPIYPDKKTPTNNNETARNKTPKTENKASSSKSKTPSVKYKTPKPKTKRKSLGKSENLLQKFNNSKNEDDTTQLVNILTTPESKKEIPVYISPFVTISRGKDSARKEYNIRKSTGGQLLNTPDGRDFSETTSPQAGAEYFENLLDNEISRIDSLCDKWIRYKEENSTAEETDNMIDVVIGQSKLLISKKFQQFRGLIAQCKSAKFEENAISCEDLHGFWDMMYGAVKDLNRRFTNLDRLKDNNWEEILPVNNILKKPTRTRQKKAVASSSLRQMIQAARNKANKEPVDEIQILKTKTPENKIPSPIKPSGSRRSLRVALLQGPTLKRLSSPGLTMMKVTQAIKAGDGLTPSKSILKTDLTKSGKRKKSVLFLDNFNDATPKKVVFSPENKENDSKQVNAALRRSRRRMSVTYN